ncbi:MAG: hypothetical protein U1G07_07305 [Verrucomicrobiota bacterium]
MPWRIGEQVTWGELDNRTIGRVTGIIVLTGRAEPLRLSLQGNPWPDWAGCVLRVKNPVPKPGDLQGLAPEQEGVCGDMTASRKVRIPPELIREWLEKGAPGKDSLPWGNSVYLEWFSERNGRVVVESTRYEVEISERAWTLTEEQEREQRLQNVQAMNQFMDSLVGEAAQPLGSESPGFVESDSEEAGVDRALETISETEDLKAKASDLSGGQMIEGAGKQPVPLDLQRQFWENVVSFESAPRKLRREILAEDGIQARREAGLTDAELAAELWRLIEALARRRQYLEWTDHLSDRELYTLLVARVLEEETEVLPPEAEWNCHISIDEYGGPGEEDGTNVYLRYYADEGTRADWVKQFPGEIPVHREPPYDRDRLLPKAS